MKISEVVEKLLGIQTEKGDIECEIRSCHFEQSSDNVQEVYSGIGGWNNNLVAIISADYN